MKKILTILCLILFAKLGFSQIVISGYLPNPSGSDNSFEYVQLVATENINFANTPYTVIFLNNGTATTKGWLVGGSFQSYGFLLNSGSVSKGDVFYVGGSEKRLAGSGSADISSETWIRAIDIANTDGDITGLKATSGKLGNGTGNADGVGVFAGQLTVNDTTKKPIDCVFYGSSVGNAYVSSTEGYPVADNDLYNSGQGLFGEGTNTTIFLNPSNNGFTQLTGTYNTGTKTWTTARTAAELSLSGTSVIGDIATKITLAGSGPEITINTNGFTNDFGFTYPNNPSSGSNFLFSGDKLTDSIEISIDAPFEIRVGVNNYSSNTIKLAPNAGVVSNTVLDVRFNPTTTGTFEDTIYLRTSGGTTKIVPVKGTASNNPEISFETTSFNIDEDADSIVLQLNIVNANSNSTSVNVSAIAGSPTASSGSDYTFSSPQTYTFPANSSDSITITIPIIDDNLPEANEEIVFVLSNATNGAVFGADDTVRVRIFDNDYRKVNIGDIDGVDADGILDSLGRLYEITGKIYGNNQRSPGIQFTIRDQTGGLGTFGPSNLSYYTPAQGDSITIRGRLAQFRGLAQLDFIDTIIFHQSNQPLRGARIVTQLGEGTESDLVRFNGVTGSGVWSTGNQWLYINGGNDSISVRINSAANTNLVGKPIPSKPFSLIGIGGQFKFSAPFTSGYQLFPRDTNDVIVPVDSLSAFDLLTPANNTSVTIQGAGTQLLNATWSPSQQAAGLLPPTYEFLLDVPTGDFSSPILTAPSGSGGSATSIGIPYFQVANLLASQGVMVGQSISLIWTVRATTTNNFSRLASQPFNITLTRDQMNSVRVVEQGKLTVYPNPASNNVSIEAPEAIETLSIASIDGKVQKVENANGNLKVSVNTSELKNGVYVIAVTTANAIYTHRLVVQQ